jgi:endo-1,4-beta-xylanase
MLMTSYLTLFWILSGPPSSAGAESENLSSPAKPDLLVHDWSGDPLDLSANGGLILTDIDYNPVFHGVERLATGEYRLKPPPDGRFHLLAFLKVPGFGKVKIFADNGGDGYTQETLSRVPLELTRELALSRARNALQAAEGGASGTDPVEALSPPTRERLEKVKQLLAGFETDPSSSPEALLRESLWLGEEIVLGQARYRIAHSPKRESYLFGANCFAVSRNLPGYKEHFARLLNFGTCPFYLKSFEPEEGKVNSRQADACIEFLEEYGLTAKGHPLVWFFRGTTPEWLDGRTFEEMKEHVRRRVERDVAKYKGRIDIWDIINEAHDWANCYEYSHDQLVEITRVASEAAKAANPDCTRIVNCCFVFADYVAWGKGHQSKEARQLVTPYQYAERLIRDGVEFEVLGLQLYYTSFDLFEHQRLLDRFARLGKPIHITEVAVPSATAADPQSHNKAADAVERMGIWRRPWDDELQADWVEGFYTLCYAHPAVEAVTWWDFSEATWHFFPNGGLIGKDGEPKQAYHRLRKLFTDWGFRSGGEDQ